MDISVRQTIINIGASYRFLKLAIAFNSPFLDDYIKSHKAYLESYKTLTGEEFVYPDGIRKLI